jgi:hypothetical protein
MSDIVDNEWLKFMSRISRQQNCDNADESSGCDDDEHDSNIAATTATTTATTATATASYVASFGGTRMNSSLVSSEANLLQSSLSCPRTSSSIKKSCISKKAQRRTYSFLDPTTTSHSSGSGGGGGATIHDNISFHPSISPIYISTKTKIAYLNRPVNIYDIFWNIPVQHYYERKEGVIKKQIKFQTTDPTFVASIKEKLESQPRCYDEFIIEHIENPNGRIPYKDQRKVSIGICKKDLQGGNVKKKRAFFNCFVLILRIHGGIAPPEERAPEDDILYKEMHVKVFNTGKLEIPGIQEDAALTHVLQLLVSVLRPYLGDDLDFLQDRCETALINSNFNCGFYIDRDKLFHLLKYKYRVNCNYDSCSYPGIQSKFYYIPSKSPLEQTGQQPVSMEISVYYEVSFMIFRTGSILIVGKCNEEILMVIYRFICSILTKEYSAIQMGDIPSIVQDSSTQSNEKGGKNSRKKRLHITDIRYYQPDTLESSSS